MNDFQFDLYCQQSALRTDKLLVAYETVTKNAELDYETASLKYISEACDRDTFLDLFTEAENKSKDKSEGILAKIWKAIKEFFKTIVDFITGKRKKSKIKDNEKYKISKKKQNFFTKGLSAIKRFFSKIGSVVKKLGPGKIIALAIATIGGYVGIRAIVNKYRNKENGSTSSDVSRVERIEGKTQEKNTEKSVVEVSGKELNRICEDAEKTLKVGEKSIDVVEANAKKDGIPTENVRCVNDLYRAIGNTVKSECTSLIVAGSRNEHAEENNRMQKDENSRRIESMRDAEDRVASAKRAENRRNRVFANDLKMRKKGYIRDIDREAEDIENNWENYKNDPQQRHYHSNPRKRSKVIQLPDKMAKEAAITAVENGIPYEEFAEDFIGTLIYDYDLTYTEACNIVEDVQLESIYDEATISDSYATENSSDDEMDGLLDDENF